jgi:hypothetical protein
LVHCNLRDQHIILKTIETREGIAKLTSRRAGHSSFTWSSTAEDVVGVVGTLSRAVMYGVGSDVGSVGSGSGT